MTETHLSALQEPRVKAFILGSLTRYWSLARLPTSRLPIALDLLQRHRDHPALAMGLLHQAFPDCAQPGSEFTRRYQAARTVKFGAFSSLLAPYVKGPVVVDIGGGDTQMVSALLDRLPGIREAVATDLLPPRTVSSDARVRFIQQQEPHRTPLAADTADTVILCTVLHHCEPATRRRLIAHIVSILKPGGRLLVLEDCGPPPGREPAGALETAYHALSGAEGRKVLAFLDWWGNHFMKNNPEIPLPCSYKSMAGWEALFGHYGLRPLKSEFLGFPDIPAHVMAPKALLAFERPCETPPEESAGLSANLD